MFGAKLDVASRIHDGTHVYTLNGPLYGSPEGYAFQEQVRKKVSEGARRVVVDLHAVDRIDSSGIGILVAVMYTVSNAGGRLILASLSERVQKALGIAMLLDRIEQADDAAGALARFQS